MTTSTPDAGWRVYATAYRPSLGSSQHTSLTATEPPAGMSGRGLTALYEHLEQFAPPLFAARQSLREGPVLPVFGSSGPSAEVEADIRERLVIAQLGAQFGKPDFGLSVTAFRKSPGESAEFVGARFLRGDDGRIRLSDGIRLIDDEGDRRLAIGNDQLAWPILEEDYVRGWTNVANDVVQRHGRSRPPPGQPPSVGFSPSWPGDPRTGRPSPSNAPRNQGRHRWPRWRP